MATAPIGKERERAARRAFPAFCLSLLLVWVGLAASHWQFFTSAMARWVLNMAAEGDHSPRPEPGDTNDAMSPATSAQSGAELRASPPPASKSAKPAPQDLHLPLRMPRIPVALAHIGACVIEAPTRVKCWGVPLGDHREYGWQTPSYVPTPDEGLVGISRSQTHACGWSASGSVYCAGQLSSGALGLVPPDLCRIHNETHEYFEACSKRFRRVPMPKAMMVSAGYESTCALSATGLVRCWGMAGDYNFWRQTPRPQVVPLPGKAVDISAMGRGGCALLQSGQRVCWQQGYLHKPATPNEPLLRFRSVTESWRNCGLLGGSGLSHPLTLGTVDYM